MLAETAWQAHKPIAQGGLLKYAYDGEYHAFNPDVVLHLQRAVKSGDYSHYRQYAELVNQRPVATLRDQLGLITAQQPQPITEVESVHDIVRRFDSAAMSLGALSPE